MGSLGIKELVIILLVVLVIFGTKKLSSIGSDLGRAVKGFKSAMNDGEHEDSSAPKQLGANGRDAEFPEAKKAETGSTGTKA
jgi:sec-independent protein translocase protein TatA